MNYEVRFCDRQINSRVSSSLWNSGPWMRRAHIFNGSSRASASRGSIYLESWSFDFCTFLNIPSEPRSLCWQKKMFFAGSVCGLKDACILGIWITFLGSQKLERKSLIYWNDCGDGVFFGSLAGLSTNSARRHRLWAVMSLSCIAN